MFYKEIIERHNFNIQLFYQQIESYNQKSEYFSGVKSFWVIQNNTPVIENLKKISRRNKAVSISTFDFSTLYTKILHTKLIFVLNKLVDFCSNAGEKEKIEVNWCGAKWLKNDKEARVLYDKESIKEAIVFLLNNCFFTIGNKMFKQIIGIPMGSDPAPFFANLFLYYYESQWINNLKENDLLLARKIKNIFDDLH